MKRWLSAGAGLVWLLGALGGGCTSDLQLSLAGKDCTADRACVDGYWCDVDSRKCVLRTGAGPDDDGGITGGAGGAMSQSGRSGQGGSVAPGGSGGAPSGGAAGSGAVAGNGGAGVDPVDPDAGFPGPADADGGCVPVRVFEDGDGDGVGDSSDPRVACPGPGLVTVAGDCRDDLPDVFPGQTSFFAEPYDEPAAPAGAGGVSFDYDCDNAEEPDPTNDTLEQAPTCAGLIGLGCQGSGFLPADDPPRDGTGFEPRCGSTVRRNCADSGLGCAAVDTPVAESLFFRCN